MGLWRGSSRLLWLPFRHLDFFDGSRLFGEGVKDSFRVQGFFEVLFCLGGCDATRAFLMTRMRISCSVESRLVRCQIFKESSQDNHLPHQSQESS